MPRVLSIVALWLALLLVGVPTMIAELTEDDCASECADEADRGSCPEQGCTDCSLVCAGCARTHVVVPTTLPGATPGRTVVVRLEGDRAQRVPLGPPPQGVFHPPRRTG